MITVTEAAAERMKLFLTNRGKGVGIRVGAKSSGCSGMSYVIEFCDVIEEHDTTFESNGVKLVVDAKAFPFLDGTAIDYLQKGMGEEGFEFVNPNALSECGCGKSFSV